MIKANPIDPKVVAMATGLAEKWIDQPAFVARCVDGMGRVYYLFTGRDDDGYAARTYVEVVE